MHLLGPKAELTYDYSYLGSDRSALSKLTTRGLKVGKGRSAVVILGVGALTEADGAAVLGHVMQLVSGTNCKLLVLHNAASRVGAMDVGANNPKGISDLINYDVIFNLGSDEMEIQMGRL